MNFDHVALYFQALMQSTHKKVTSFLINDIKCSYCGLFRSQEVKVEFIWEHLERHFTPAARSHRLLDDTVSSHMRSGCCQPVPSADPGPISHTALTSVLITALTGFEVRFYTSAAISCSLQPVVSHPASHQNCHLHFTLASLFPLPSLWSLLSCKSFITLFGQLTPSSQLPVAKAWFLIKPSNCEVKSQFHAPYSW